MKTPVARQWLVGSHDCIGKITQTVIVGEPLLTSRDGFGKEIWKGNGEETSPKSLRDRLTVVVGRGDIRLKDLHIAKSEEAGNSIHGFVAIFPDLIAKGPEILNKLGAENVAAEDVSVVGFGFTA